MPNKQYAYEWIELARRSLETAELLIREKHYTDIIAIGIQQTLEKAFKAVWAFHGARIPKTHSLPMLFYYVNDKAKLSNIAFEDIVTISDYYESGRYPGPKYQLPSRTEVEQFFMKAQQCFIHIVNYIDNHKS